MMRARGTDRVGRERHALHDRVRVGLHERPVELGARVGLEAVGDHVAHARRADAAAGAATWRRWDSPRRRGRAGRTSVTSRMTCSGVRCAARRPPGGPRARASRGRVMSAAAPATRRARASRIEGQPRRAVQDAAIRRRRPWATVARSAAAMVAASVALHAGQHAAVDHDAGRARADSPRQSVCSRRTAPSGLSPPTSVPRCSRNAARTRPPPSERAGGAAADRTMWLVGRLEAQVRIAGRDAVQLAVPGAGLVGDVLERRDRQVAVGVLGLLQDAHRVRAVGSSLAREDRVQGRQVDGVERLERGDPAPGGRSAAARTPRAARRTARAAPQWTWNRFLVSTPPMSMHSMGQAAAHWKQVSHLSVPHSS